MPVRFRSLAPLASFLLALFATAASAATAPPPAPVRNVEEEHWGVKVEDPYRYMENIASPEVRAWILAQGAYTDSVMTHLPVRDPLLARIKELDAGRPFRVSDIRPLGMRRISDTRNGRPASSSLIRASNGSRTGRWVMTESV